MDFSATQVYEDEDFSQTSHALEEAASEQVGTLSINSIDHQIKKGITKIGRLNSCDIVLDDMTVSKIHAEIEASGGQGSTWICDLKSSNKTKLNDLKMQPNRSYELKDGSILEFGKVHAIYRTCCPADNTMIPETPAPPRKKPINTVIPNTPDSSLNNSSGVDDDRSIILGTRKDAENSVFRRPRIPQQCQSTSIDKKNTSMNENNDSRIGIKLYTSDMINVRETRVSLYDAETQKFNEEYNTASNSIDDMETQGNLVDILEHVEANAKTSEHQSKQNICNKRAGRSVTDIHDIETQNCINDINEMETQKNMVSIQNATGEKFTTDIHTMETQNYVDYANSNGSNAEKSNIDKNNSQEKCLTKTGLNINLETQNKCIEEDISDLETQLELGSIARCEPIRDISDMEIQFEADSITNETSDRANKDKDKNDITHIEGTNHENITKSPKSRSNSPGSLNLSSPGVEDYPSSPLNQSVHLLESTDLLEYFNQSIDKQEVQAFNMSTPKSLTEVSSKKNSNVENLQDMVNNEENDEDIFEAPTQCGSRKFETLMSDDSVTDEEDALAMCKVPKKTQSRKPQSEQIDDDSETDAEEYIAADHTKKQCQSSKTLNKPCNEDVSNKNDPGTSIESEDMFDAQTQRLNNSTIKDTSNSSINQPQNSNEIKAAVDDTASTQIINNIDQNDQTNTPTPDINDMAPTQLVLSRESSPKTTIDPTDFASRNNPNDVDDMANTCTINAKPVDCCTTENLDCENMDYELAPTQVIGETKDKEKENSTCERSSPQVNLNDTLERELTEMFDDVNNDVNNDHESPHMSTQYLENILQSSQCDNSVDKSFAGDKDTSSVPQKQTDKKNNAPCNQHSHNLLGTGINANVDNVNKAETDLQNSDIYFSTVTTRRKKNILITTQEPANSVEDTTPCQDVNFSQTAKASNEKTIDDNMEYNKKRKRISKMKNKSDARTETLNNENRNKTISSKNNKKSLRSSKLTRQKDEAALETSKQVLEDDPVKFKVNDAEENTSICTSCPSENGQRAQTLDTLCESDDDILTRLPAVRMSGTLSNPASPSASSTSTVLSTRSKQSTARSEKKKNISLRVRPLRKRNIKNSEKNDKPSVDSHSNSVRGIVTNSKMSSSTDTSDGSDSETQYQRFQQMADRVLKSKPNCLKRQDMRSRKIARDESEDPKRSTDVESKNPARTSSRVTRHSSKQSDESSHNLRKKAYVKNTAYETDESTKSETKSTVTKRKISLNSIEESVEQVTSKKSKIAHVTEEYPVSRRNRTSTLKTAIDRQSPNIEYLTKRSTPPENSSENMKSFKDNEAVFKATLEETQEISLSTKNDGNVDFGRANVKRTRRIIYDSQVPSHINDATANEGNKKNKLAQIKETETQASQSQGKVLRILINPIKIADDESQEVERIMARGPSNTQDKNISIRESSKAKIFQRRLRTRSRKQDNSDTETDSVLTESGSMSSEIEDSDNTQLDNSMPKAKRGRYAKSTVSSLPKVQVLIKKETFKKPTRINRNSTSLILNSSAENMAGESSQDSTESDASTSSRASRSKTASIRKKKMESNQNRSINESASRLNTSIETTSLVSTPSRTRRSTSILNNSISSAIRHKVLFTGIMEDYNMIVKSLGGIKVEDPAKCTVLVTDKVRRTYKFLCTLAMGIPIVAIDWLRDSETTERFVDWENYILKDPVAEAKFGFRIRKSLGKAKEKKLLDGYVVVLTPNVAPPPIQEFKDIISSCGGKALLRPPAKWPERAVVLSREEDLSTAKKFIAKAPKTVTVQSTEFILTGILRQELDFVKYKLMG